MPSGGNWLGETTGLKICRGSRRWWLRIGMQELRQPRVCCRFIWTMLAWKFQQGTTWPHFARCSRFFEVNCAERARHTRKNVRGDHARRLSQEPRWAVRRRRAGSAGRSADGKPIRIHQQAGRSAEAVVLGWRWVGPLVKTSGSRHVSPAAARCRSVADGNQFGRVGDDPLGHRLSQRPTPQTLLPQPHTKNFQNLDACVKPISLARRFNKHQ